VSQGGISSCQVGDGRRSSGLSCTALQFPSAGDAAHQEVKVNIHAADELRRLAQIQSLLIVVPCLTELGCAASLPALSLHAACLQMQLD